MGRPSPSPSSSRDSSSRTTSACSRSPAVTLLLTPVLGLAVGTGVARLHFATSSEEKWRNLYAAVHFALETPRRANMSATAEEQATNASVSRSSRRM